MSSMQTLLSEDCAALKAVPLALQKAPSAADLSL